MMQSEICKRINFSQNGRYDKATLREHFAHDGNFACVVHIKVRISKHVPAANLVLNFDSAPWSNWRLKCEVK